MLAIVSIQRTVKSENNSYVLSVHA